MTKFLGGVLGVGRPTTQQAYAATGKAGGEAGASRGESAIGGAGRGAQLGSMIAPGIGTAVGGIAGGLVGLFAGGRRTVGPQPQGTDNQVYDPFGSERAQYAGQLRELMTNPEAYQRSPSFAARLRAGEEAVTGSAAGRGLLGSGQLATALQRHGQELGSADYDAQVNRLVGLSGANMGAMSLVPGSGTTAQQSGVKEGYAQGAALLEQYLRNRNTKTTI